ncbi:quinone oxidoreductase family protein [Microlunatus antarcticus]|uniref:NADPH:quinone reductase-like Zn-dependent oxidoreductase n=1 Tax=Microlunatus antarcticus TaxID=53388 RepID=A0A7W5P5T8_9ACTN|nr:NADPH:quinone reductase-like Zn-dependent oxidoreductase [Microlunatus antarcticus]
MAQHWVATRYGNLDGLELREVTPPAPSPGEVTIEVAAAGMNPADYKRVLQGQDANALPAPIGFEVAGVLSAIGEGTEIGSGPAQVGDAVLAFRIAGGYASALTVPAKDVFAKPDNLDFAEAANLLLAGTTAAEMLDVVHAQGGETILLHGASGAVGVSVLQQARRHGVRVIGTASERSFDVVTRFGGTPVAYGPGLADRVRRAAPSGIAAALDSVGTDEAVDVSLELVPDRERIVTIAAAGRAQADGIRMIGGAMPASAAFRDRVRADLIALAAGGDLVVPMARTFPLAEARAALDLLRGEHPGGKLALIP